LLISEICWCKDTDYIYKITSKGKDFLEHHPTIKISDLETIPEFHAFSQRNGKKETEVSQEQESTTMEATPSERMENAYSDIEANLSAELKDKIIKATPAFFEKIVVNLLVAMGYGGDLEDAATVTQPTRDGGIDGVIKEDPLGLDKIYVQAKRWSGMVGVHEIRDFGSALDEVKASKGVIITTSDFTQDAIKSAEKQSKKIVLINGQALTSYMIKYNIGVSVKKEYIIKKIDNDYFEEEE
jgi:restriction system protein